MISYPASITTVVGERATVKQPSDAKRNAVAFIEAHQHIGFETAAIVASAKISPLGIIAIGTFPSSLIAFSAATKIFSEGPHLHWRELQLGVAFDLLRRILRARSAQGSGVPEFIENVRKLIADELDGLKPLQNAVLGERYRAREAARKAGKIIPLELLTPYDAKPFKRGRVRLAQAIAAVTAGNKRKK